MHRSFSFRNKDLDPKAEEFIVGWAKELPRDATLALVIDLDREAGLADEAAVLREAIHEFFSQRAQAYGRRLRELFRCGPDQPCDWARSFSVAIVLGDFLAALMKGSRIGEIVRESLTSVAGSLCGVLLRFSYTTGGQFAMRRDFPTGLRRCQYASGI